MFLISNLTQKYKKKLKQLVEQMNSQPLPLPEPSTYPNKGDSEQLIR